MKYLIFSDIHGSIDDLMKVLSIFKKEDCDKIICLGDVLYHGPRNDLPLSYNPKRVVEELNKYKDKIICVKGNCDSEVDSMVLEFKIYNQYHIKNLYFVHGHHLQFKNMLFKKVIFYGHTHIYDITKMKNAYYINPGSISIPKDDKKTKTFIILENKIIKIYDLNNNLLIKSYMLP